MGILPYAYALLVFGVVAFLFVLLGRIFLNVETIYIYKFKTVQKQTVNNITFVSFIEISEIIEKYGKEGWKLESIEDDTMARLLIFSKTKNKIKFL